MADAPQEPRKPERAPLEVNWDRAEPSAAVPQGEEPSAQQAALACDFCKRPIAGAYFTIGPKALCADCRARIEADIKGGSRLGRFARATLFGSLAGALGAALWYGVAVVTKAHWGIIAIVVGVLVGKAVRKGTGGRGGRVYQFLAVFLTYCAITARYTPELYEGMQAAAKEHSADGAKGEKPDVKAPASWIADWPGSLRAAAAIVLLAGLLLAVPILVGVKSIIGLIILGIALYEAWKMNTPILLAFQGPFLVGAPPSGGVARA